MFTYFYSSTERLYGRPCPFRNYNLKKKIQNLHKGIQQSIKNKYKYNMELVVKILNLVWFNGVTVDSDPFVLYAGGIFLLSILAIMAFFSLVSFILIILGYNPKILNYLGK